MNTATVAGTQVYQLYINAPQEKVWEAITTPSIVARYFHGSQVAGTYQPGTQIRVAAADGLLTMPSPRLSDVSIIRNRDTRRRFRTRMRSLAIEIDVSLGMCLRIAINWLGRSAHGWNPMLVVVRRTKAVDETVEIAREFLFENDYH